MDKHWHRLKWRRLHSWLPVGIKDASHVFVYNKRKKTRGITTEETNKPIQQISRLSIKTIPSISRQPTTESRNKKKSYAIKCESNDSQHMNIFKWEHTRQKRPKKQQKKAHYSFDTFRFLMYHNFSSLSFECNITELGYRNKKKEKKNNKTNTHTVQNASI